MLFCLLCFFIGLQGQASAGEVDEDQLGAWYMYFWSTRLKEGRFGFQGDIQYRNYDLIGDLEQLLIRGGLTYNTRAIPVKFTLGYAYVLSGDFGSNTNTSIENRIYQEALIPQKPGGRFHLNHRFRFEQRWVEKQDFRTRFRYGLFINVALNGTEITRGTFYYAFYNDRFYMPDANTGEKSGDL